MNDYPQDLKELQDLFESEHACIQFPAKVKRPDVLRRCKRRGAELRIHRTSYICKLKRRILGTLHGCISRKQLKYHLDLSECFFMFPVLNNIPLKNLYKAFDDRPSRRHAYLDSTREFIVFNDNDKGLLVRMISKAGLLLKKVVQASDCALILRIAWAIAWPRVLA
jgi:hypothetical protein